MRLLKLALTEAGNAKLSKWHDYTHNLDVLKHVMMMQHGLKKVLKEFGDAAMDAMLKELKKLHDRQVIKVFNPVTMTWDQKCAALHYLMFLKKKRCRCIKGQSCADGQKQCLYNIKEKASSPMVAIELVMLSLM